MNNIIRLCIILFLLIFIMMSELTNNNKQRVVHSMNIFHYMIIIILFSFTKYMTINYKSKKQHCSLSIHIINNIYIYTVQIKKHKPFIPQCNTWKIVSLFYLEVAPTEEESTGDDELKLLDSFDENFCLAKGLGSKDPSFEDLLAGAISNEGLLPVACLCDPSELIGIPSRDEIRTTGPEPEFLLASLHQHCQRGYVANSKKNWITDF